MSDGDTRDAGAPARGDQSPDAARGEDLGGPRLTRLLRLGLASTEEPVEELALRLLAPDGAEWLEDALRSGALPLPPGWPPSPPDAAASIDALRSLKGAANALIAAPPRREALLTGMFCYFAAIAGGMAHHGDLLSRQDPARLLGPLRRLGGAGPGAWGRLFREAARRLEGREAQG